METSVKINDPKSIPKLQCAEFLLLHCISFVFCGRAGESANLSGYRIKHKKIKSIKSSKTNKKRTEEAMY